MLSGEIDRNPFLSIYGFILFVLSRSSTLFSPTETGGHDNLNKNKGNSFAALQRAFEEINGAVCATVISRGWSQAEDP